MIQPLSGHDVWGSTLSGTPGVIGVRTPDNEEIVEKVNEIIKELNKLLEGVNDGKDTSNAEEDPCKESRCSTGSVWVDSEQ